MLGKMPHLLNKTVVHKQIHECTPVERQMLWSNLTVRHDLDDRQTKEFHNRSQDISTISGYKENIVEWNVVEGDDASRTLPGPRSMKLAINHKVAMANQYHRCMHKLFKRLTNNQSGLLCLRFAIDCKPLRYGAQNVIIIYVGAPWIIITILHFVFLTCLHMCRYISFKGKSNPCNIK